MVLRDIWTSTSYKFLFVIGTALFQGYYYLYIKFEESFTTYSPSLGYNNTLFFFGNVPGLLITIMQFCVIVVTLRAFSKIVGGNARTELQSRPFSNRTILLGYVVAASIMMLALAFANSILIYASALAGKHPNFWYGNIPALLPALNLLFIDLPLTFLFWSAVALLLRILLDNSLFAFIVASLGALAVWFAALIMPFDWAVLLSSSSHSSMVVSDLTPRLPSAEILLNRALTLVATIGICSLCASLWQRQDEGKNRYVWSGTVAFSAAMFMVGLQYLGVSADAGKREDWTASHRGFNPNHILDLRAVSGTVEIDPGNSLHLNLVLTLAKPANFDTAELVFSFNPGMSIQELSVDGSDTEFSFENGLLRIPCASSPCADKQQTALSIEASGTPDLRFGNMEPEIDYLHSVGMSPHLRKIFGTDNSLFNGRYIALLPSIRWFPMPGPLSVDKHVESLTHPPDFFDVELTVSVNKEGWNVAAPGGKNENPERSSSYEFRTSHPVSQLAVLASRFDSRVMTIGDLTIELLVHERHADTIDALSIVERELKSYLTARLDALSDLGIQYKNPRLTFVEVPSYLRTVSGYGMSFINSLPGLILVKESSIPLSSAITWNESMRAIYEDEGELRTVLFSSMLANIRRDYTGGDLEEAFARQLHPYAYQQFATDGVALNSLRQLLISNSVSDAPSGYRYEDAELVANFAPLSKFNPIMTFGHLTRKFVGTYPTTANWHISNYLRMGEASSLARTISLRELDPSDDLLSVRKILYLKLEQCHRALKEMYGEKALHTLIAPLSEVTEATHATDSVEDIYRRAAESELKLGPFLREWLTTSSIPGFRTSRPISTRVTSGGDTIIEDDELRYRASFYIRNDHDSYGVMQFSVMNSQLVTQNNIGPSIEIEPQTSYRVNLYSNDPIDAVEIDTFHSKNEGIFFIIPTPGRDEFNHDTQSLIKRASWVPSDDPYIIVDNLDPSVEILWNRDTQPRTLQRIARWLDLVPDVTTVSSRGVHKPLPLSPPFLHSSWISTDFLTSYGRYQQNIWEVVGDAPTVRFSVNLPSSGDWILEYHVPPHYVYRRHKRYNFILRDNDVEHSISLNVERKDGWLELGVFDLKGPMVQLDLVSVKAENSRRVVDATRWKLKDE